MDTKPILPRPAWTPEELRERDQWVCWASNGGRTGGPLDCRTGEPASMDDPGSWASFDVARRRAKKRGWGIGFVPTADDDIVVVRLVDAVDFEEEMLVDWAFAVVDLLDAYREGEPGRPGVINMVLRGRIPCSGRWHVGGGAVEVWDRGRFVPITGEWFVEFLVMRLQRELNSLFREHLQGTPQPLGLDEPAVPERPWGLDASGSSPPPDGDPVHEPPDSERTGRATGKQRRGA